MIIQFLEKMANYGVYVWTSFPFVTVACSVFYYKTKKTLSKYEKEYFKELKKLSETDRESVLRNSKVAKKIFVNLNKTA